MISIVRLSALAICCCAALLTAPVGAESLSPIERALEECQSDAAGMSTQGMVECVDAARVSWDIDLNRIYAELLRRLPDAGKTSLRASQRAWVAFRDREIEAVSVIYGQLQGTMFRIMAADAVMQLTRSRVAQLDATLTSVRMAAGEEDGS